MPSLQRVFLLLLLIFHCGICASAQAIRIKNTALVESGNKTQTHLVPYPKHKRIRISKKPLTQPHVVDYPEHEPVKITIKTLTQTKRKKGLKLFKNQMREQEPMQATANGIVDILKAYFVKPSIEFNIRVFGEISSMTQEQLDLVYKAWHRDNLTKTHPLLTQRQNEFLNREDDEIFFNLSALIFIDCKDVKGLMFKSLIKLDFTTDMRFVLFVERHQGDEQINKWNLKKIHNYEPELDFPVASPFMDIIYKEADKLTLWTITWFDPCNKTTMMQINEFDMNTKKWKKNLKFDEKFTNLNNCTLTVHHFGMTSQDYNLELQPQTKLMEFISERMNFSLKRAEKNSWLDFEIGIDWEVEKDFFRVEVTPPLMNGQMHIVIPIAEPYSPYEKILLPFDDLTWYLLAATFSIAFGFIFVVSLMNQRVQNLVYGEGVKMPAYNVLGTFFGIGQQRLPQTDFARFILLNFIWFCLIFRTAYQGVFFEMFTTDMRKQQPKSVDDLIVRNYTIVGPIADLIDLSYHHEINFLTDSDEFLNDSYFERVEDLQKKNFTSFEGYIEAVHSHTFNNTCEILQNSLSRTSYLGDDLHLQEIKSLCHFELQLLEEVVYERVLGVCMPINHFLFFPIANVSLRLVEAGILQNWFDFYYYSFFVWMISMNKGPQVLTLEVLSFGFIIWLCACCVAVIVLAAEIIWFWIVEKTKTEVHSSDETDEEKIRRNDAEKVAETFQAVDVDLYPFFVEQESLDEQRVVEKVSTEVVPEPESSQPNQEDAKVPLQSFEDVFTKKLSDYANDEDMTFADYVF